MNIGQRVSYGAGIALLGTVIYFDNGEKDGYPLVGVLWDNGDRDYWDPEELIKLGDSK